MKYRRTRKKTKRISSKISFSAISVVSMLAVSLVGLFYFSYSESVPTAVPSAGRVRGQSVRIFEMPSEEVFIISAESGDISVGHDVLLLSAFPNTDIHVARVVRDTTVLLFEQQISGQFDSVRWDEEHNGFLIFSKNSDATIHIVPDDGGYMFVP